MPKEECPRCFTSGICSLASTVKNQREQSLNQDTMIRREIVPLKPDHVLNFIKRTVLAGTECVKQDELKKELELLCHDAFNKFNDERFNDPALLEFPQDQPHNR